MRVADYIVDRLYRAGVHHTFMVSGGGMMFLSDALHVHPDMDVVCNHHEQASAMAAVGYAKYTGGISAAFTSTGCGATNAITGLLTAWQDNVPVVFISGQVKQSETTRGTGVPLRQLGTQEADVIAIVQSITKYAVMVTDPAHVAEHLEQALQLATSGRPGPVWIDVPMDVQGAQMPAVPPACTVQVAGARRVPSKGECHAVAGRLSRAKRPVIIAGQGVRIADAIPQLKAFVERYKIPVVAPYLGVGMLDTDHPMYVGVIGIKGSRAGNLAVQNADLVLSIGSRLSVTAIGYEYSLFAREALITVVDIDPVEHKKRTIHVDHFVHADAKEFLTKCILSQKPATKSWLATCQAWKEKYPVCLPEYRVYDDVVSMYHFIDTLSTIMEDDAVVISDAGSAFYVTAQAINLKGAQRFLTSGGQAEMGFTLPACIGASFAKGGPTYGVTGDGSFQMNIQDLQTIAHHKLPIKLFILNNNGYLSIRATQTKFFEGRLVGTDGTSGLSLPDTQKIADAYGIMYRRLQNSATLAEDLQDVLAENGPVICEVICPENEPVVPTAASKKTAEGKMVSRPLEDMMPFLDRDEYLSNMIVHPVDE
ncbi:hypothetical protein A3C87_03155 [Candidatus Kaiserbacteria bacterium RIFCSPHIGHO2_02_FULL_49_34]|uniref:Acetolactate synthase n=1 Tax=Candidatus Kaiserbacteria bacterium RIFCSPHIGHO2_02_FULL_49_34 TaxID=1798491 RepID=A0A1F6DI84_9BACT|nr:MAG: hypothetical protein A3C87_03155 [Candidatus Kaiserbacteria bacterium RIFCSPHIGHO2_02_FULL_49_34]